MATPSRRTAFALLALVALACLLVLFWVSTSLQAPPPEEEVPEVAQRTRTVRTAAPAPPPEPENDALLAEATRGALGVSYRNRVCRLCRSGALDDPACADCPEEEEPLGRVVVDLVDEDGRPYPPHEASVKASCRHVGVITSGHMDLPEGRCTLTPIRVDGLLDVVGDAVEVEVVADEEQYVLVQLPRTPWGAVGLDLTAIDGGVEVRRTIEGTHGDTIPVGARILAVDGVEMAGLGVTEVAGELNGPVDSEVTVTYEDPDTGDTVETTIRRSRLSNRHVDPNMVPG